MLVAVFQFINTENHINDNQRSQFSSVKHVNGNIGTLTRKDSSGRSGHYYSVPDVQTGMRHKLTSFKLEFKYNE